LTKKDEEFFENELGFEKGHLKKNSRYWDSFKVKVPSEGVLLDLEDPLSLLKYTVLKADPLVASNQTELKSNPYCEYVMIRESEKAENESESRSIKIKSYGLLDKMTAQDFQDVYLIVKNADPTDLELPIVRNEVEKYAETMPSQFVELMKDGDFKDKVFITKLIKKGIIIKTGRGLKSPLYFNDTFLGNNVEECMAFLKEPTNNNVFIDVMKIFKSTKKESSSVSLFKKTISFEEKEVEEKEGILTEKEKLELKVKALEQELIKKEQKEKEIVITEEVDASEIVRDDNGYSENNEVSAVEEVDTEIIEKPARTRRGKTKQ